MKELTTNQKIHCQDLVRSLENFSVAFDISETGAGKTIIALETFKWFRKNALNKNFDHNLCVICPPALINHWKAAAEEQGIASDKVSIHSMCALKNFNLNIRNVFLIVDEIHFFKNSSSKRHQFLARICTRVDKRLFISATPIDSLRHLNPLKSLTQCARSIAHLSYKTSRYVAHHVSFNLVYNDLSEDLEKKYSKGFKSIRSCVIPDENPHNSFNPRRFSKGIQLIHQSLIMSLVKYVKDDLMNRAGKIIVVIRYLDHFDIIKQHFPDCFIISGSTSPAQRRIIQRQFQENNSSCRLLVMSCAVGGVGLEFDDQYGTCPRHMVLLPTTSGTEFKQLVGRIMRFNTKSNASVSIIQPLKKKTYFKRQMINKLSILKCFNEIPSFIEKVHEHKRSCALHHSRRLQFALILSRRLPVSIYKDILQLSCSCLERGNINNEIEAKHNNVRPLVEEQRGAMEI